MRDVEADLRLSGGEQVPKDRHSRDAVHVVVAIQDDAFLGPNRIGDDSAGLDGSGQLLGRQQIRQLRAEEAGRPIPEIQAS